MLAVAIERDEPVVAAIDGRPERIPQAGPIALVAFVPNRPDCGEGAEQFGRAVGRSVIDDQDVAGVPEDLGEDRLEVLFLIIDGDGGEDVHWRIGWYGQHKGRPHR